MTLTEIIEVWVGAAERMNNAEVQAVVVTPELFADLMAEQGSEAPIAAGVAVRTMAAETPAGAALPTVAEMVEIPGPDRLSVYVGAEPDESTYPIGLDPAMPVFFIPASRHDIADPGQLERYNQLRWYGLGPDEALAGSRG